MPGLRRGSSRGVVPPPPVCPGEDCGGKGVRGPRPVRPAGSGGHTSSALGQAPRRFGASAVRTVCQRFRRVRDPDPLLNVHGLGEAFISKLLGAYHAYRAYHA